MSGGLETVSSGYQRAIDRMKQTARAPEILREVDSPLASAVDTQRMNYELKRQEMFSSIGAQSTFETPVFETSTATNVGQSNTGYVPPSFNLDQGVSFENRFDSTVGYTPQAMPESTSPSVSKAPTEPRLNPTEFKSIVDEFKQEYSLGLGDLNIQIVDRQEDAFGEESTVDKVGVIEGAYLPADKTVFLVSSSMRSAKEARRVIRHEIIGHHGLNTFKPEDKKSFLDDIIASKDSSLKQEWQRVLSDEVYNQQDIYLQAEEVFTSVMETEASIPRQVLDAIITPLRRLLRKGFGNRIPVSRSELRNEARIIAKGMRSGERTQQTFPQSADALFSRRGVSDLTERVENDYEGLKQEYASIEDTKGGLLLSADEAKKLSKGFERGELGASDVHGDASNFVKRVFKEKLEEPSKTGAVLFTAGGAGAGKSTGLDVIELENSLSDKYDFIYDGTLAKYENSKKKIEQVLDTGRQVAVMYTYRDPVEAFVNGVLPRGSKTGRAVPLTEVARTHLDSRDTIAKLMNDYKENPNVAFVVNDNSRGKGNSAFTDFDKLPQNEYDNVLLESELRNELERQRPNLDQRLYEETGRRDLAQNDSARKSGVDSESLLPEPEQKRSEETRSRINPDVLFSRRDNPENTEPLLQAWKSIANNPKAFKFPRVDKVKSFPKLFAELTKERPDYFDVETMDADSRKDMSEISEKPITRGFEVSTEDGGNASIYENKDEVWVDVSGLTQGGGGSQIYNAVSNYAYNTGKTFIGDPMGLVPMGVARRLENMISSALKFGTTAHIRPHENQRKGGVNDYVDALDWREGDHDHNLLGMLKLSYSSVAKQFPDITDLRYNSSTNTIQDSEGNDVNLDQWLDQRVERIEGDEDRYVPEQLGIPRQATSVGRQTLRRAVIIQSVIRGEGAEQQRLLEEFSKLDAEPVSQGISGVLYSRRDREDAPTFTEADEKIGRESAVEVESVKQRVTDFIDSTIKSKEEYKTN